MGRKGIYLRSERFGVFYRGNIEMQIKMQKYLHMSRKSCTFAPAKVETIKQNNYNNGRKQRIDSKRSHYSSED